MEVTWETPSGDLIALDGSIDPFLQEVYLEPDAIPLFLKLVALDRIRRRRAPYVDDDAARRRITTCTPSPNFCKASKRLYNLFRMTDELAAAAYVRELFDRARARGCIRCRGCSKPRTWRSRRTTKINREVIVRQLDRVVLHRRLGRRRRAVADLVIELIRLRDIVTGPGGSDDHAWAEDAASEPRALQRDRQRVLPVASVRPAADPQRSRRNCEA